MKSSIVLGLLIACTVPAIPVAEQSPDFTFTIQTEKRIFKPGEPIWGLAFLQNQSRNEIYVPHAMSPCIGYESEIIFSVVVVKGKQTMHGRGCGVGSGCSGGCQREDSFEQHVKASWVLLKPGEIFGARFDSYKNAPDTPGTYKLEAEYVPKNTEDVPRNTATGGDAVTKADHVRVIANSYKAAPVEIIVRR